MDLFIGIDGGGTKTELVITDAHGILLNRLRGVATNPASAGGISESLTRLHAMIIHALSNIPFDEQTKLYVFAGISGMGNPQYREEGIRYLSEHLPNAQIGWDHDGVNALYSGTLGETGGVLIAGTGSVAFGMDSTQKRIRIGGWGNLVGDEGSGFALGRLALKKIMEACDGRGKRTLLTDAVLSYWSLSSPEDIIKHINDQSFKQQATEIVPLVFEVAEQGDSIAIDVIREIGREQGSLIKALAEQIHQRFGIKEVPIVLAGGLFAKLEWFNEQIDEALSSLAFNVKLIIPTEPPVIGALAAAYKLKGIPQKEIVRMISGISLT